MAGAYEMRGSSLSISATDCVSASRGAPLSESISRKTVLSETQVASKSLRIRILVHVHLLREGALLHGRELDSWFGGAREVQECGSCKACVAFCAGRGNRRELPGVEGQGGLGMRVFYTMP